MKKLIIGTTNEAKVDQIRGALMSVGIETCGLPKDIVLPSIVEDGENAKDNARKKASTFARALNQRVLSMDNSLYLDGLPKEKQPGVHVRRIPGYTGRPSDEALLNYYSALLEGLGGKVNGYWEFAICVAKPNGEFEETVIKEPRIFVSERCKAVSSGYPLESLQIDPDTGKYTAEMTETERDEFWQKAIGKELCDFVSKLNL